VVGGVVVGVAVCGGEGKVVAVVMIMVVVIKTTIITLCYLIY